MYVELGYEMDWTVIKLRILSCFWTRNVADVAWIIISWPIEFILQFIEMLLNF